MQSRRVLTIVIVVIFLLLVLTPVVHPEDLVFTTPEQVLLVYITSLGEIPAGECANTISPDDVGKICWKFIDQQADMQAYLTGRTFSEFSTWLFVREVVEEGTVGYRFIGVADLDFFGNGDVPWPQSSLPQ